MFYDWGRYLEKRLNVVYLDQRGCGESAHYRFASPLAPTKEEARDFSIANLLKDIEGVRTFLKLQRWYVLGHSWGGMLGIAYVAGHPHRVLGYVHMDGMISVPMTRESVLANAERNLTRFAEAKEKQRRDAAEQGLAIVRQLRSLPQDDAQRLFGALSLAMGPGELYFPRDQQARFAAFTAKMMEAIARYKVPFEALLAFEPGLALVQNDGFLMKDVRPLLSAISAPSLVINGEQDGVITPQMARIVHQAVSSSRLVLLDECGHFPFADRPAEAAREILKLVGSRR
jgi:proline iminopeptidase